MRFDNTKTALLKGVEDEVLREFLYKLMLDLQSEPIIRGEWKFFEIEFKQAVTNYKFPHQLKFVPRDVIQTQHSGVGLFVWNYDQFDNKYLDITTTGACKIRAFVGQYKDV
jgi:hypothetical protein